MGDGAYPDKLEPLEQQIALKTLDFIDSSCRLSRGKEEGKGIENHNIYFQ